MSVFMSQTALHVHHHPLANSQIVHIIRKTLVHKTDGIFGFIVCVAIFHSMYFTYISVKEGHLIHLNGHVFFATEDMKNVFSPWQSTTKTKWSKLIIFFCLQKKEENFENFDTCSSAFLWGPNSIKIMFTLLHLFIIHFGS